jgi:hypothetical protein
MRKRETERNSGKGERKTEKKVIQGDFFFVGDLKEKIEDLIGWLEKAEVKPNKQNDFPTAIR